LREYLSFKITDPTYNAPFLTPNGDPDPNDNPANANNPNPSYNTFLAAFDATRINPATGSLGSTFFFEGKKTGKQFSFYLQDSYKWKNLTINAGLRVTNYRIFVEQTGTQPRVGLSYHIAKTGTVLRASYDRLFITPENEGLLITSSPQVIAATGSSGILIRPEIQNSYEVGFQQRISNLLRIDGAYYTKDVRRPQDNDQFLNTGLLFPLSFGTAKLKGFDLKIDIPERHGVTAYVSFGTNSAIFSPPATGGLLGEVPTSIFRIDHDQKVSIQSDVRYYNQKYGWWTAVSARYDSGLVTDFDPAVLNNPDLAFGAQYVRGTDDPLAPFRIRPRAIFNYSAGIDLLKETHHPINLQFDLLNLTDKKGLYNFLSPFGGTHVIPPRTYSIKVKLNF
jgi:TonB dependent receptor